MTTTKICRECRQELPINCFQPDERYNGGHRHQCRFCCAERIRKYKKRTGYRWVQPRVDRREANLLYKYGLTVDDYNDMLAAQGGRCAICKQPPKSRRLAVDHCHKTGAVRGLLCSKCNTALGLFGDQFSGLATAADYLGKARSGSG